MFFLMDEESNEEDKRSFLDLYENINVRESRDKLMGTDKVDKTMIDSGENAFKFNDSDSLKHNSDDTEQASKMEEKRQKGKMRSRKSRERKKLYIDELEMKVKNLEKENMKLHYLLESYKNQIHSQNDKSNPSILGKITDLRRNTIHKFIDMDTMSYDENTKERVTDHFSRTCPKFTGKEDSKILNIFIIRSLSFSQNYFNLHSKFVIKHLSFTYLIIY